MLIKLWCSVGCVLLFVFMTQLLFEAVYKDVENHGNHVRKKRSIEDSLPIDEFPNTEAIMNMKRKILSQETEIEKLKSLKEKCNEELTTLQQDLSGDSNALATPEENLYAVSNQKCGGLMVAQSGSIVFTSEALRGTRFPPTCVWTIRANNRESIKIMTTSSERYATFPSTAYVVEMFNNIGTNGSSLQTSVTHLERNMHRMFKGPIVFIVYALPSFRGDVNGEIDLQLHYEGMGKLTEKTTHFSHEYIHKQFRNFSSSQIKGWENSLDITSGRTSSDNNDTDSATYTLEYTSIVISNFSTKVHLQAIFENGSCGDRDTSFFVVTDVLESSLEITDCCGQSCVGKNSLVNDDNPFVIIITKKYRVPLKFTISWEAEPPYPSSSKVSSYTCGEVLGGVSGTILYKPNVSYRNGERCIWTIVPQPRSRSSIIITVGANGVESMYDQLYIMELTDVNGTGLADAPIITTLGRYGTYEANSREVYIVFYSDSDIKGTGFSLSWKIGRDAGRRGVKRGEDVTTKFTIIRDDYGSATSLQEGPSLSSSVYQVFILTPVVSDSSIHGKQLLINLTHLATTNDCLNADISIYTVVDGILSKPDMTEICRSQTQPGIISIENADGMAMVIVNDKEPETPVEMSFDWREEICRM